MSQKALYDLKNGQPAGGVIIESEAFGPNGESLPIMLDVTSAGQDDGTDKFSIKWVREDGKAADGRRLMAVEREFYVYVEGLENPQALAGVVSAFHEEAGQWDSANGKQLGLPPTLVNTLDLSNEADDEAKYVLAAFIQTYELRGDAEMCYVAAEVAADIRGEPAPKLNEDWTQGAESANESGETDID